MAHWDLIPLELQNSIMDRLPPRLQHLLDRRNRDQALGRHFGRDKSTLALSYAGNELTGLHFFLNALKGSDFWCYSDFAVEQQGIVIGKPSAVDLLDLRFCNLESADIYDVVRGIELIHGYMPGFLEGVAIMVGAEDEDHLSDPGAQHPVYTGRPACTGPPSHIPFDPHIPVCSLGHMFCNPEKYRKISYHLREPDLIHPSMSVEQLLQQLSKPVAAYHDNYSLKQVQPKAALMRRIATNLMWLQQDGCLWAQDKEELYKIAQKLEVTGQAAVPYIEEADFCVRWAPETMESLYMAAFLVCEETFGDGRVPMEVAIQVWMGLFRRRLEDGLAEAWCAFYLQHFGEAPVAKQVWDWIGAWVVARSSRVSPAAAHPTDAFDPVLHL